MKGRLRINEIRNERLLRNNISESNIEAIESILKEINDKVSPRLHKKD